MAILSKALHHLGVKRGDRVALYAPRNCPEWHIGDFAILGLGAVDVPIYANESAERMTYILNDSGAKIAIVAGQIPIAQIMRRRKIVRRSSTFSRWHRRRTWAESCCAMRR